MKVETVTCTIATRHDTLVYETVSKTEPPRFFATLEEMQGLVGEMPRRVTLIFSDTYRYSEAAQQLPVAFTCQGVYVVRHLDYTKNKDRPREVPQGFPVISGELSDVIKRTRISSNDRRFYLHYIIQKEKKQ